jgi:hypothetical protein
MQIARHMVAVVARKRARRRALTMHGGARWVGEVGALVDFELSDMPLTN